MALVRAWEIVKSQLQSEMDKATYATRVDQAVYISFEGSIFTIGTPDPYTRDWMESYLGSTIARKLTGLLEREAEIRFITSSTPTEITADESERPQDFDLVDFWEAWCRSSSENRPYFPVTVRVAPRLIASLPNHFGEGILAQIQEAGQPDEMGWTTLVLPFEYHEQALERLLPFGGRIEVLEPLALRYSIQDHAEQILAVYSDLAT